jgi:hypothetical protein
METAETADATGSRSAVDDRTGVLFPLMLIAAIAVIAFSAVGIAAMLGWMPGTLSSARPATQNASVGLVPAARAAVPPCGECGRVESLRPDGVRVLMDDGSFRTFSLRAQPPFSVGQKVRVTEQGVAAAG